jgi:hypothetical protein
MSGWSLSTSEPTVDPLLVSIREAIVTVTGSSLVGLYLFGSLTAGDFDAAISEIDLLAVLADAPSERLAARLRRMHADLARANSAWDDRIEVIYISAHGLATCRTHTTTIAVISPGEPFHVVEAGHDWVSTGTRPARTGCGCLGRPSTRRSRRSPAPSTSRKYDGPWSGSPTASLTTRRPDRRRMRS